MKVAILAGGKGTRLAEETVSRPKPMVSIGGMPILWHIMQIYAHFGHEDFYVACGYMGEQIKEYFLNYCLHANDYRINLKDGSNSVLDTNRVNWQVSVINTGLDTLTGGRLLRLQHWLSGSTFMLTYGDGVGDVDINALVEFHRSHGRIATVTAVRPPARFGELRMEENLVTSFSEKPQTEMGWINGGFFVFEPAVFDYLDGDMISLEADPLERLAKDGQLMGFHHDGFWQPMDTLRDNKYLESLWEDRTAPWKYSD